MLSADKNILQGFMVGEKNIKLRGMGGSTVTRTCNILYLHDSRHLERENLYLHDSRHLERENYNTSGITGLSPSTLCWHLIRKLAFP